MRSLPGVLSSQRFRRPFDQSLFGCGGKWPVNGSRSNFGPSWPLYRLPSSSEPFKTAALYGKCFKKRKGWLTKRITCDQRDHARDSVQLLEATGAYLLLTTARAFYEFRGLPIDRPQVRRPVNSEITGRSMNHRDDNETDRDPSERVRVPAESFGRCRTGIRRCVLPVSLTRED